MNQNVKIDEAYKTIGEVTKELGLIDKKTGQLQTHTIRYWETQFKQIKPSIRAGNRRYYSNKDFQVIKLVKFLLKEKGLTIFITTHYLEEADYLCDRIGIIDNGKILIVDSPVNLKNQLGGDIIDLKLDLNDTERIHELNNLDFVKKIDVMDKNIRIRVEKGEIALPLIIESLNSKGIMVTSVSLDKPSLDEVFLKYTGRSLRDAESEKSDSFKMYFARRRR